MYDDHLDVTAAMRGGMPAFAGSVDMCNALKAMLHVQQVPITLDRTMIDPRDGNPHPVGAIIRDGRAVFTDDLRILEG